MKTRTVIERIGENMGPVDWTHPKAAALPHVLMEKLREAEKDPAKFCYSPSGFSEFQIVSVCMYDGWPYWTPTPAFSYIGPLKILEWGFFDSYGVSELSVRRVAP